MLTDVEKTRLKLLRVLSANNVRTIANDAGFMVQYYSADEIRTTLALQWDNEIELLVFKKLKLSL